LAALRDGDLAMSAETASEFMIACVRA
jgi:hypothetical protein